MPIEVHCPECQSLLRIADENLGRQARLLTPLDPALVAFLELLCLGSEPHVRRLVDESSRWKPRRGLLSQEPGICDSPRQDDTRGKDQPDSILSRHGTFPEKRKLGSTGRRRRLPATLPLDVITVSGYPSGRLISGLFAQKNTVIPVFPRCCSR